MQVPALTVWRRLRGLLRLFLHAPTLTEMIDGEDQCNADHQPGNKDVTSGNKNATSGNKEATSGNKGATTGGTGHNTTEVPETPARTSKEVAPEFLTSMKTALDTLLQKSTTQEKVNEKVNKELHVVPTASKTRGKGNTLFRTPGGRLNPTVLAFSTPLNAPRTRVFSSPQPPSCTTTVDVNVGARPPPATMRTTTVIDLENPDGRNLAADLVATKPSQPGRNPNSGQDHDDDDEDENLLWVEDHLEEERQPLI